MIATNTPRLRYRWLAGLVLATALASAAPAEAAQLVRYDTGGGLAGRSMRLVVSAGGTAVQTDRDSSDDSKRFKISISQLHALKRELKAAKFSTLKRRYDPKRTVFDGTTEGVTYKGKTVVVTTGGNPPERLNKVLSRLSRLAR